MEDEYRITKINVKEGRENETIYRRGVTKARRDREFQSRVEGKES